MRAVYADHLEELSDPRAEFVRLELRWHEAISQLRELRPKIPADWRAPLRRQWGVELTSPGHLKLNVIKQVRGITGYGLREAKELVDDATIGKKPMVLQAVDLARAVAALEWLLTVEGVQARIAEGTAEPIALYDFETPAHGAPVDDARRLRWADSFGDDPRGAFIRAELAASRAAERLAALSRGLDAAWQVAVGRWWAVRLDGTERLDAEEVAPLRARFALAEPQWEERALLGRLPPWVMDGLDRRAAEAVALAVADFPGVRAEVVRSPSRLAWLLGVERARGASCP